MPILQTVEFITNGHCGDFHFAEGEIYEYVAVQQCDEGCCWLLKIGRHELRVEDRCIDEVLKFLNTVPT